MSASELERVVHEKEALAQRYEELRGHVLARGERGLGFALFLGRGMAAWMEAWSRCAPRLLPQGQAGTAPSTRTGASSLPDALRDEVAQVLASMAMQKVVSV